MSNSLKQQRKCNAASCDKWHRHCDLRLDGVSEGQEPTKLKIALQLLHNGHFKRHPSRTLPVSVE
eukprot:2542379-Amphidinium_carterae.1